jgi:hypothetical protein
MATVQTTEVPGGWDPLRESQVAARPGGLAKIARDPIAASGLAGADNDSSHSSVERPAAAECLLEWRC